MVETRVVARTVRMLARHVRCGTQWVVLASRETGAASFITIEGNHHLRQDLEAGVCRGFCALGMVAFDRQKNEQRRFCFPWLQDDPYGQAMFETICRNLGDRAPGEPSLPASLPSDPNG